MKKIYFLLLAVIMFAGSSFGQVKYFSKAVATDFNDINTWGTAADGTGTSPIAISSTDTFAVANAAVLSLSANASIAKLLINSGSLSVSANSLTVSHAVGNNSSLTIAANATLNVSGGSINLNGQFAMVSTAKFLQSGGTIKVDGNAGGVATNSISGNIVQLFSAVATDLRLTGGTFIITDPSYTTSYALSANCAVANNSTAGHTFQFGDGVSTDAGGINGFYTYLFPGASYLILGNVVANGGTGTNRFVNTQSSHGILGNLTVNANSEYRLGSLSTNYLTGNLVNNGTLTTIGTLYFGTFASGTSGPSTVAQTVTGAGVFRNLAATPTANFASLTVNNTSAAGVNFANGFSNITTQPASSVSVSATLTFLAGKLTGGSSLFVLGTSVPATGTLSYGAGGFLSGTKFGRWSTAASTGSAITAAADPTTATSRYPFITAAGGLRSMWISRTSPTAAGIIGVTYNEAAGTNPVSPVVVDGTYSINTKSNDSWTTSLVSGTAAATSYILAIVAPGSYAAPDATTRIMKTATVVGVHQNGTATPGGQRITVPVADLVGTYFLGYNLPTCFVPTSLTNNLASTTSVNHSWSAPTSGTVPLGYEYVVSTSAIAPTGAGTPTTSTSISSTGLMPNTTYYLYVRSSCGGADFSTWVSASFYTGFCLASSTASTSWLNIFATTGGVSNINLTSAAGVSGGYADLTANAVSNYLGQTTNFSITVGGPTVGSAIWVDWNNNFVFEASEKMFATTGYLGTTPITGTIAIPSGQVNGNYRMRAMVDFNNSAPTNPCGNISRGEYKDFTFSVVPAPLCTAPTALTNSAITNVSATHSWSAPTTGTVPAGYEYAVTTSATPPATGTSTTGLSASSTTLLGNTVYYLHVRNFCGGTDFSTWATATFTTVLLLPTPYSEPFTATTTPAGYNTTGWTIGSTRGVTGNPGNNIYKNLYSSATTGTFTTVNVGPIVTGQHLTFDYKTSDYSSPYGAPGAGAGNFVVSISTDYGVTYTTLPTVTVGADALWTIYDTDLSAYVGQNVKIRVVGNWVSGDFDLGIDNIKIQLPPTCFAPTGLTNSAVTSTGASHAWTAAVPAPASGYEYAVTTSATPPTAGTLTTGLTASSTGLTANTTYYLHVRSNCGAGLFSSWATSTSFFTGYCTPAPISVDGTGITNVAFGTINNPSAAEAGNYGNYSAQSSSHQQGASVPLAITFSTSTFDYNTNVWIDLNDNLVFEASELVATGVSGTTSPNTLNLIINIPNSAPVGSHRLRIGATDAAPAPTPCYTGSYGTFEDYTINITLSPPCAGPISGGTATSSVSTICGSGTTILNTIGAATGTGLTYQWQSSPAGAGTFTDIVGATTLPYTTASINASTDFQLVVNCVNGPASGSSTIVSVSVGAVPLNDECAGAITVVTQPDNPTCTGVEAVNTACATLSTNTTNIWGSSNDDDLWYKFTATATSQTIRISNAVFTGPVVNIGLSLHNDGANGTNCANVIAATESTVANVPNTITLTAGAGSGSIGGLTVGTTYTLRLLTQGTGSRVSFRFCLQDPPPTPPNCTTNISPANGATNIVTTPNIPISWNAAPTATSYDIFWGTTNPPTASIGNVTGTSAIVTNTPAGTTIYWYISPKNGAGNAVGCVSSVTSFTASFVCTPTTTNGGTSGDALVDFVLNGESSTAISVLGAAQIPTPGYVDLSATQTVTVAAGKAYYGTFKVQDVNDRLAIWIDFNNNGGFEATERVLNYLTSTAANASTPFSILIPSTSTPGIYKMRVRDVYNTTATSSAIDACTSATWGECKDFTVVITAAGTGSPYALSNEGAGACADVAYTVIDAFSNNNNQLVPILDTRGNLVAEINANGNDLGKITSSQYIHTGAVRTTNTGQKYLNRNVTITPATQPATAVKVNLYMTDAEYQALLSADPTIGAIANLICTKNSQVCGPLFITLGTEVALPQTANGTMGTDKFISVNTPGFSTFFINKAPNGLLPISIEYINGTKQSNGNIVDWKITCNSAPDVVIELQRSADARSFRGIYIETATAVRCQQAFVFNDASPAAGINYYRLKVTEPNGSFRYSNIIAIINKDKGYEIVSLAPNPVRSNTTLTLSSAKADKVNIVITDIVGQVMAKQAKALTAGNNTIAMNFDNYAAGTYTITITNGDGEVKTTRFMKY